MTGAPVSVVLIELTMTLFTDEVSKLLGLSLTSPLPGKPIIVSSSCACTADESPSCTPLAPTKSKIEQRELDERRRGRRGRRVLGLFRRAIGTRFVVNVASFA